MRLAEKLDWKWLIYSFIFLSSLDMLADRLSVQNVRTRLFFFHVDRVIFMRVTKLRNETSLSSRLSVHLPVCLSVHPHGISRLALDGFRKIRCCSMFLKTVERIKV
jgi:hypothetical protein